MNTDDDHIYSIETVKSIMANPDKSWKSLFKEMIISMIASNQNDLLWYANFLSRCEYEFHFNESFVSSVYFNGNNFVIIINPLILGVIHKDQIIAILKHSAGHMINHHFTRSSKEHGLDKEAIEVAMDIVINGSREIPYIKDIPGTGNYNTSPLKALFYQTLTEKYGIENYETGREFEYYARLMVAAQEQECAQDSDENDQSCNTLESKDANASQDSSDNNNSSEEGDEDSSDDQTNTQSNSTEDNEDSSELSNHGDDSNEEASSESGSLEDTNQNNDEPTKNEENDINFEASIESSASEDTNKKNEKSPILKDTDTSDRTNIELDELANRTLETLKNGNCEIDSHAFGEQLQEAVKLEDDILKSFMDTALEEMINDSTSFARGFTPGEATGSLGRIEKRKSHKDWKKIFNKKMRNSFTNSLRYREPNKSRQHPIFQDDLDLYGYSPGKKPKLAVVLDVSGSVDDKLLSALMSEVQSIQKKYSIKTVTLVQVDMEIKAIEKFGVHDKFLARHGSGGTIMEPGFSALLQQSSREIPDMIICATDGDIEEKFEELKIPTKVQVIWLVKKEGQLAFDTSTYPKQQMHVIKFSV